MTWFDVLIIIIIVFYAWSGLRHGLLAQVVGLVGFVAAFLLALLGGRLLASVIVPLLNLEEEFSSPEVIEEIFAFLDVEMTVDWLAHITVGVVGFLVLFILLQFVFRRIASTLKVFNRVPLLGGLNSLAGGGLGLLKGVIFVFLLVSALSLLPWEAVSETLHHSVLAVFIRESFPGFNEIKSLLVSFYN